jgi:cytochrome c oxidase cbb3-type subunit 3
MTSPGPEVAELPQPEEPARDGIGENDAPIPLWFNVTFYASIVFAIFYILYYNFSGWSQQSQYAAEVERTKQQLAASEAAAPQPTSNPYHGNAAAIAEGKQVFDTICVACHLPDGSGLVGPSLVDPYWKYGHDDATLFETVSKGRPGGMPAWGPQLGTDKIWKALAYVETLPKSDKPGVGAPGYQAPGAGQ